jgi:hypothetical protein
MRKLLSLLLLSGACIAARADQISGVIYAGGTLSAPAPGAQVSLDLSSPEALILSAPSGVVRVPWNAITRWGCFRRNKHRLGVLPTIAAGLVAARIRDHYFNLAWTGADGSSQAILLHIPPELPKTLHVVLEAHAPGKVEHNPTIEGAALE